MNHFNFRAMYIVVTLILFFAAPAWSGPPEDLTKKLTEGYLPKQEVVKQLHQIESKTEIVLFHGAWCPDCQREVPKFMKIISEAGNPNIVLIDYKVDRNKKDVLGKFEEYQIRKVPTFIVIQDGVELGRIIETPQKSLEEDLLAILKGSKTSQ